MGISILDLQNKPSKKLAVLWTIAAVLFWVNVIVMFNSGPKTAGLIGDVLWNAVVSLGFTYVSVVTWRKYYKASKQSLEIEKQEE
ncbi:MAG: hypothetical protein KAJ07_00215 [Planctomycetes bacterium]|nr:hypothetical protein [Planctomycetota bacterium]